MAQSVIGALRVNLGLDSAQFDKGSKKAGNSLKDMRKQFLAVSGAALALGAGISAFALRSAQDIDKAAKAARRLGSSIGGYRALEMAAGEAGVSLSALANDVQTMDREIAKGSKGAARSLKTLGLSAKDLEGLEADEKIALVADSIQKLGLDSGQASVILQDLGVRNREMVLAVLSGGDAFRQARADVEDYGLAISSTDSEAIEQANDRIGRLGLIGQYAGQQLAVALVPALGAMAQAMTDSMRAGGLLRGVIDLLVGNIDTIISSMGVAVTVFGVQYVAALAAAAGATGILSGALVVLKAAIFATGIGALIIGAGYLIAKFVDLVKATGGFGEALTLLGEVAAGVWDGIVTSAGAIPEGLFAVWSGVRADFFALISDLMVEWSGFLGKLNVLSDKFKIPGTEGMGPDLLGKASGGLMSSASEMDAKAQNAAKNASTFGAAAGAQAAAGFDKAKEALAKLTAATAENAVTTNDGAAAADALAASLGDVADSAGGGGGGKGAKGGAAKEIEKIKPALDEVSNGFDTFKSSVASAFEGLITGASSFKEALSGVLKSLASMFAQSAFSGLFDGFKIPGFATGTPHAPGGLSMINERGGEIVDLPNGSRVIPHELSKRMLTGGQNVTFAPVIDARGADVGAVQRLEVALAKASAEFESRAINAFNVGKKRRQIV